MTRMKSVLAALVVAAIVGVVPQAHAQTVKVILSGSSAIWQSLALGAYNAGKCVSGGTAPCFHYTNSSFNLNDTRPTVKGGTTAVDSGAVWIVWDSAASPNVWAFVKVDSGVGDRCYFAQPHCNISIATFPSPSNLIGATLWGDDSSDSTPPASVQGLFTAGQLVNSSASDIRAEDALFATCRANSKLGNSTTSTDGLGGLGYNSTNASGVCGKFGGTLSSLDGNDVQSGYPGSTSTAHLLAWALTGKDPFTGTAIPVASTVPVGATPVTFIIARSNALAGVTNVTDQEVQSVFSGANCNADAFGAPSGSITAFLREPTSGTMNTTEYSVFRYWTESGASQETGVNATNPLVEQACAGGGGVRSRAIGTGEEVKSVLNSNANTGEDGIGYTFFSYGNVSSIANNSAYGYVTLNGVDPIFHKYGTTIDPGQPSTPGVLPAAANLPASCSGAFPCPEKAIWSGNLSFPNLRNGSYKAWSNLRVISNGTALSALELLVEGSQTYATISTPDFVPAEKVGAVDPGLPLLHSHYLQEGVAPVNVSATGDRGGDAGGCILTSTGSAATSDTTTTLVLQQPGQGCAVYTQ
jgi:hypothetical protein